MANREEVKQKLAQAHYRVEPGITQIFTICDPQGYEAPPDAAIKLLEVNENTPASGILPIQFDPAPASGVPYPSIIIEVTPGEFERIRRKELPLPNGWTLGPLVPREGAGGG